MVVSALTRGSDWLRNHWGEDDPFRRWMLGLAVAVTGVALLGTIAGITLAIVDGSFGGWEDVLSAIFAPLFWLSLLLSALEARFKGIREWLEDDPADDAN